MAIRNILRGVKNAMLSPIQNLENRLKKVDEARRARDTKMIEQNWGSVEEYHRRRGK